MLVMEKLVTDIPDLLYDEMLFSRTIDEALTFVYLLFQVEFTRCLIMLVMEKLVTDIPDLLYDEMLFSRTIDEALTFVYLLFQVEFARGLIMLVMEKLVTDIPDLLYDEMLFSHTIDEALTFDTELRTCHGYPSNQPGCLHVLTEHDAFEKWIIIERKCKCLIILAL